MIRKLFTSISILAILSFAFTGCKKGEEDPFLSLKSRKARISGEWEMTNFSGVAEFGETKDNLSVTYKYSYSDGKVFESENDQDPVELAYAWSLTFDKDGNYSRKVDFSEEDDIDIESDAGGYLFMDKNKAADRKKGQFVQFLLNERGYEDNNGSHKATIEQTEEGHVYEIIRLTDKELIIRWAAYSKFLFKHHPDNTEINEYDNLDIEITFTKK